MREVNGTVYVRIPFEVVEPAAMASMKLAMQFDDASGARRQTNRTDVAHGLLGQTSGLPAGVWTGGWDDVPVEVRGVDGEHLDPARIDGLSIAGVPVGQLLAQTDLRLGPAAITQRDGVRQVRVLA